MKGLVKKVIAPIAFGLASLLPASGFGQVKSEEFKPRNFFSLGAGLYNPSEKAVKEIYGNFPRGKITAGRDFSPVFRVEGTIAYSKKEGEPIIYGYGFDDIDASSEMSLFHFEATGKYVLRNKGANFYFGGGVTFVDIKEKLEVTAYLDGERYNESAEAKESASGLVFMGGVEVPVDQKGKTFFYGEISTRSAKIKGALGDEVDVGGVGFDVGVRFF